MVMATRPPENASKNSEHSPATPVSHLHIRHSMFMLLQQAY